MTRANIVIYSIILGIKFEYCVSGDGYPSRVMPELKAWDGTLESLTDLYLQVGRIGNFYYAYELNLDTGEIKAWDAKTYWVNAPSDWKERGWNCWENSDGKPGYTSWRKGKVVEAAKIENCKPLVINRDSDPIYNSKELKKLRNKNDYEAQYLAKYWKDPIKNKLYVSADKDAYEYMYAYSDEDLPLHMAEMVSHPQWREAKIYNWRLNRKAA